MGASQICIIGNLNIDLIIRQVPCLPKWGQEVIGNSHVIVSSGQATYTGLALQKLSMQTSIIGNVGDDIEGKKILTDLEKNGVNIKGCEIINNGTTGITVAIVRENGERAFVSDPDCLKKFSKPMILKHWEETTSSSYIMLVGLFFLPGLSLNDAAFLAKKAQKEGKATVLDTGWDTGNWQQKTIFSLRKLFENINIFLPNLDEARAITGKQHPKEAAQCFHEFGVETVIIKMGPNGSFGSFKGETVSLPAFQVKVYDTVGAGDVFNAGFLLGHSRGFSFKDCLAFGNAASHYYISHLVDRFPIFKEVYCLAKTNYALDKRLIDILEVK
ncbi:MAG: carbohydrate kinase family protein [Candidatus Humimicrobiaceae bacterium]